MTPKEAINTLNSIKQYYNDKNEDSYVGFDNEDNEALDMAIKALEQQQEWIPIKWHEITDEERVIEEYPNEWLVHLDCQMPDDGERILVQTKWGNIELDECYIDDGCYLDSGYDWVEDVIAWMPLPEPYKESEE